MGSFEDDMFVDSEGAIDTLADLDKEQHEALADWVAHFDGKYIDAGRLLPNGHSEEEAQEPAPVT